MTEIQITNRLVSGLRKNKKYGWWISRLDNRGFPDLLILDPKKNRIALVEVKKKKTGRWNDPFQKTLYEVGFSNLIEVDDETSTDEFAQGITIWFQRN